MCLEVHGVGIYKLAAKSFFFKSLKSMQYTIIPLFYIKNKKKMLFYYLL